METKKPQSIDSILDAKIVEFKKLLDRKDELEELTKANNKAKEELEQEIVQIMIDNEKPSTVVDGFNYSLKQETRYSKKSEDELERLKTEEGIEFFEVLREQGLGDIIKETVNANTLQSTMKALVEELVEELPDGEPMPEELAKCLSIYPKMGVNKRKASKSAMQALERAKKTTKED